MGSSEEGSTLSGSEGIKWEQGKKWGEGEQLYRTVWVRERSDEEKGQKRSNPIEIHPHTTVFTRSEQRRTEIKVINEVSTPPPLPRLRWKRQGIDCFSVERTGSHWMESMERQEGSEGERQGSEGRDRDRERERERPVICLSMTPLGHGREWGWLGEE